VKQPLGTGGGAVLRPGGAPWMVDEVLGLPGAVVADRTMHDHVNGWDEGPPFTMPVFAVTHWPHPVRVAGATTFTLVPGVETAVVQAKAIAGGKNVYAGGGASVAGQALRPGLVDELSIHIEPVLPGGGARLPDDLGTSPIRLERTRLTEAEPATHPRYRVRR